MDAHRIFTPDEATALVPFLTFQFERLARLRAHVEAHLRELARAGVQVDPAHPLESPCPARLRPTLVRMVQMVSEVQRIVTGINACGCLVKDLEQGLVDFHGVVDGEPVFLCWQFGEDAVRWYHPHEGGFAARRPLEPEALCQTLYN
ncbi:MAG: DUF2203 family protein [Deltaproteobacteria bacterium]|nr:MAG: DUF2203 family protein [Deltaproteobacteria bacterium]